MTDREKRIQICKDKYNLNDDYIKKLFETSNDYLTVEDLRLKYDYKDLGVELPDWLTQEEFARMAFAVAKLMYRPIYCNEISYLELVNTIYVDCSIKMYTIRSHQQLKHAMIMRCCNRYRDIALHNTFWSNNHIEDTEYVDEPTSDNNNYGFLGKYLSTRDDDKKFVDVIKSVKQKQLRMILIISGYLLADMDDLYDDFCELFNTEDEELLKQLESILDAVDYNDNLRKERASNTGCSGKRKISITFNYILKALGLFNNKKRILGEIADVLY